MILDDELLNAVAAEAKHSERLRMNRDLRNSADDTSQRMLNALEVGTVLPIHRHRSTSKTQILLRGRIDVMFYDDLGRETDRFRLDPRKGAYGVDIPAGQWHSLTVLEPAVIFEALLCAPEAFFCGGVSGSSSCGCWPSPGRWRGCGSWPPPCRRDAGFGSRV